jgi:hypothetical protein
MAYQTKPNAARVAAYREMNKENAGEQNRTHNKDYLDRSEKREK